MEVVSARLGVKKALTSHEFQENVNYAVKSSLLLSFLESVPEVSARLKAPNSVDVKFADMVQFAQAATGCRRAATSKRPVPINRTSNRV